MPVSTLAQFKRNTTSTTYADTNVYRRSPAIWADCPFDLIQSGVVGGVAFYDDFQDLPLQGTLTTQIGAGKYKVFGDTGNTITKVMSNTGGAANATQYYQGGALQLAIDTDNDEVSIAQSYPSLMMTGSPSTSGKLWFEACFAINGGVSTGTGSVQGDAIPTNNCNVFLGLAEVAAITLSTAVPIVDDATFDASGCLFGFRLNETKLGVLDAAYNDRAVTMTNVSATGGTTAGNGNIGTLTAWNFVKVGFVYDPSDSTNTVTFFFNGVTFGTKLAAATITATTNLKVAPLGLMCANSAASAGTVFKNHIRWWRVAQIFAGEAIGL